MEKDAKRERCTHNVHTHTERDTRTTHTKRDVTIVHTVVVHTVVVVVVVHTVIIHYNNKHNNISKKE